MGNSNSSRIVGFFPGQGSQSVGMGKALFDAEPLAQELMLFADDVLGFSLSKLCFEGPIEELTLTKFTQPALLAVSYTAFRLCPAPLACAAGHSLGEYSALVAAQALSFGDALQLVHKRGCYMQEAVAVGSGKMAAIMGPSEAELQAMIAEVTAGVAEIANINSPGQIVVAGDSAGIDNLVEIVKQKGAKAIPLNVSAPFHCCLMEPAARSLAADLDAVVFNDPKFPVYANVTAHAIRSGAEARELLKRQVCATVRWSELVTNLVAEQQITQAIEFGPGGVLSKLLKRIDSSISATQVYDPATLATTHCGSCGCGA